MPQVRPHGTAAAAAQRPAWATTTGAPAAGGSPDSPQGAGEDQEGSTHLSAAIFESYAAACGLGGAGGEEAAALQEGCRRVEEHLRSAQADVAACLVCLDAIKHTDAIWHCTAGCFEVVHLTCIQAWARQQLAAATLKAEQRLPPALFPAAAAEARRAACWGCPKCRQEYGAVPADSRCYCGKEVDPPFDPWHPPHSCGERCERPSTSCGHTCMLLCHPGPCPPCPRQITATCHCGRSTSVRRCLAGSSFSCTAVCGKVLLCGHSCPEACHPGDCPPCGLVSAVRCRCGAQQQELPCSQHGSFQCGRVCGKLLACGHHSCTAVCHSGGCGACKLAGPRACPCGKHKVPGAACNVEVPPCGDTCGRLLSCGVHHCNERCHTSECTTICRELVEKGCRCGRTTRHVQCHEEFKCATKCGASLGCGRHQCRRRCCDGDCPPCEEVCNRWLRCRNHRCPAPCHSGPCSPCPLTAVIPCACGATAYRVPCGREASALPPRCSHPCPVAHMCRHSSQLPEHSCHFGPCIACTMPCGTQLPCGHSCSAAGCHDPLPPAVGDYQPPPPPASPLEAGSGAPGASSKRDRLPGPAADLQQRQQQQHPALAAALAAAALAGQLPRTASGTLSSCPPCTEPVAVGCLGGHCTKQMPCSEAAAFACGVPCGRPLACGNHSCTAPCHDPAAAPCSPCRQPCIRPRPHCEHPCPLACHPPGVACPPCTVRVSQPCHCGKTTLHFACFEVTEQQASLEQLRCPKPCHRALPNCPHVCTEQCHPGACPGAATCGVEVAVRCPCKRLKRRLPCREVQQLLAASNGACAYDINTPLRLLECTGECAAASSAAAGSSLEPPRPAPAAPVPLALAPKSTAAAAAPPPRKLSKEDKAQQREEARAAREAAEAHKQRQQRLVKRALLAAAVLLVVLVGLAVRQLLLVLDRRAQAVWGQTAREL